MDFLIYFIPSVLIGSILGFVFYKIYRSTLLRWAREEAQEILGETQEALEIRALEEKERHQEIETQLWSKHDADFLRMEENIEGLQEEADENKKRYENIWLQKRKDVEKIEQVVQKKESYINNRQKQLQSSQDQIQSLNQKFVHDITEKFQLSVEESKNYLSDKWISEARQSISKYFEHIEEDVKLNIDTYAKKYLDIAYDRFARPYCPERGIAGVFFPDAHSRKNLSDPKVIKAIEDSCGCDIIIEEQNEMIGVAGYDPVRRELTRRTLEKLIREKKTLTAETVTRIAEQQKKELFNQIRNDGDQIARELRLDNLNPEIRKMMGSLRFRYSFTQNQYFHCGEVGWLCGLLASELGESTTKARRSGMLHDIGKSMDHNMDGGHAMIGADFIEKRGEAPDIVHNVRAHHYDVQPSSEIAFLVIAADAISGARPGARRSTIESYNQKVTELQDIAYSFEGVIDCLVLSGGRECRVLVNGKKINDQEALQISKKIAHRIEEECNYPGQIKVVVVRETVINESTQSRAAHA